MRVTNVKNLIYPLCAAEYEFVILSIDAYLSNKQVFNVELRGCYE
jgi:hypothetical protein